MASRKSYIIAFTVLSIGAAVLLPARPQPVTYHNFADHRAMFGVANFLDVASNLGFLLAAIAGLAVVLRPRTRFECSRERWPYAVFFLGMLLTAVGSAYYHLAPDNGRLFWDRLPMTIAFMALIAAQVVDRVSVRAGLILLLPMLLVGAASVVYWRATERAGAGNVVPYGVLQGYSVAILLPDRNTLSIPLYARQRRLLGVCGVCAGKAPGAVRPGDPGVWASRERPHAQARRCCRGRPYRLSNVDATDGERVVSTASTAESSLVV